MPFGFSSKMFITEQQQHLNCAVYKTHSQGTRSLMVFDEMQEQARRICDTPQIKTLILCPLGSHTCVQRLDA